jgi:hypothetical protein
MSPRALLSIVPLLLVPLAAACDRTEPAPTAQHDEGALQSSPPVDTDAGLLVMSGQLRSVDAEQQTLTVSVGNETRQFAYTDTTEIAGGASNVRGLAGSAGDTITVHFREDPLTTTRTAVRIELE